MMFIVEQPDPQDARCWFAFDEEDLLRKVAAMDTELLRSTYERLGECEPIELAEAMLQSRGPCRLYPTEAAATAAFEREADPFWQGAGWRARWALRDQLIAMEVLADDL